MIYLHDRHILEIGIDWPMLTGLMEETVRIKAEGDCVHPLKPYLRFRDRANRIIAMPAFVGGSVDMAGIKWIASFPNNRRLGLPRAHNTMILNDPATGEPAAFIHSGLLSAIRTAAVSGLMMEAFLAGRPSAKLRRGIVGCGPVGRMHLDMCTALFGDKLERIALYDLLPIDMDTVPEAARAKIEIADDWRQVYRNSDIFITCTVSAERYIDEPPRKGALLLNVSLRDYKPESVAKVPVVVVDDWQEVCRENTDIERLHLQYGLLPSAVLTLEDVICHDKLDACNGEEAVFFNPMGLAVFDISAAKFYLQEALRLGKGIRLEKANEN
ncbi:MULTISPECIES: 2,3-diaminopropionate biosynthesis protein SbnB [Paenibacillus]|uniref:2,3-diaminopropionate biosynthesis protein SbnB n=1 Tax=Paenibacillus TaxID=44249 RepID=UPI0022B8F919|nr:2,3-diaminopropionate biosynthesis protein SbnB [Paenibacillus caseinilyticus]MCZ8521323.1 2,3-diaminopropionate biosynthesis protein SbnB [Paenibacillus caseinilyticus]